MYGMSGLGQFEISNPQIELVAIKKRAEVKEEQPEFDELARYHRRTRILFWVLATGTALLLGLGYFQPIKQQLTKAQTASGVWQDRYEAAHTKSVTLNKQLGMLETEHSALLTHIDEEAKKERVLEAAELQKVADTKAAFTNEFAWSIKRGRVVVAETDGLIIVSLIDGAVFDPGKVAPHWRGRKLLALLAKTLSATSNPIEVVGYTDSIEPSGRTARQFPTNWEISSARALNVVRHLHDVGKIPKERLSAIGRGSNKPIANNATKAGRSRNRRIELVITP